VAVPRLGSKPSDADGAGLENEPLDPASRLVGKRTAEPDAVFPEEAVAETVGGMMDPEILEILSGRDSPSAQFHVA
jgi:hypothetical protein